MNQSMIDNPMVLPYYRHDDDPEYNHENQTPNPDCTCAYCDEVFDHKLKLDDEGLRCCSDCMAINAALDNLPPAQTMKEAG